VAGRRRDAPGGRITKPRLCALRYEGAVLTGRAIGGNTSILSISADVYVDSHRIGLAYVAEST
jgi:hypothetical protein